MWDLALRRPLSSARLSASSTNQFTYGWWIESPRKAGAMQNWLQQLAVIHCCRAGALTSLDNAYLEVGQRQCVASMVNEQLVPLLCSQRTLVSFNRHTLVNLLNLNVILVEPVEVT